MISSTVSVNFTRVCPSLASVFCDLQHSMAHTVVEVKFAQNLAANERKTRDKALKKLKKYLRLKSSKKG